MATDGTRLVYNPEFVENTQDEQICSLQAHECGHKMFLDHLRRGRRDPRLWNVACDYRINYYLKDSGLKLSEKLLYDERFHRWGWDAEKIYDFLEQNPDDPANKQSKEKGGCGCGGLRDHQSQSEQDDPSEGTGPGNGSEDSESGSGNSPSANFGEAEVMMSVAQARAFAKARGKMPGSLEELIEEILNPKIRWEQVLQRFMECCCQDDFSWQVPDRRFLYLDMYLPGVESEGVDTFTVVVDTSGSTISFMTQFLSEVSKIARVLKFKKLYVIYCDTRVQHVDEYGPEDLPIKPSRTYGGGGTDFRPVFNWIEERGIEPKGMVFLTDTYGAFPTAPTYPVLWTVPKDLRVEVPFGEILRIE